MNITSALILFTLFIIFYSIMVETFTVLFRLTGITREKARTQVISLLTNCGFTTSESELIMANKQRRRLAQFTMLCGYSFSVLIISMLVNIFLTMNQTEAKNLLMTVLYMILLFLTCLLIMRLPRVHQAFDSLIEHLGNRLMFGKGSNLMILIDIFHEKAMVEVIVNHVPSFLENTRLADSHLKEDYEIQLLFLKRNGERVSNINGETRIQKGDSLVLFGNYHKIRSTFS